VNKPLVSVLIPSFNARPYIGETLDSVLLQTWGNIEIIVVDDGSTDDTPAVVERYRQKGVRLISQKNAGAAAARNKAFAASRGLFIQFLDADDILKPNKIALQMARLMRNPAHIASAEWGRFYNNLGETCFEPESNWADLDPVEWLVRSREDGLGMLFPAIWLLPRAIADAAGAWDETLSLGDDGEYFTRAVLASKGVLFCEGAKCHYRSGLPRSLSRRKTAQGWNSQFKAAELCERHVLAHEDSERVRCGFALSWQHIAHMVYPYDPRLAERALERARFLHSVRIKPAGGPAFRVASCLLGWRVARKLQMLSGRV
jgi:glycosyltransferase involved in cell wall biosynthesis